MLLQSKTGLPRNSKSAGRNLVSAVVFELYTAIFKPKDKDLAYMLIAYCRTEKEALGIWHNGQNPGWHMA